jgi:hypothetical protein
MQRRLGRTGGGERITGPVAAGGGHLGSGAEPAEAGRARRRGRCHRCCGTGWPPRCGPPWHLLERLGAGAAPRRDRRRRWVWRWRRRPGPLVPPPRHRSGRSCRDVAGCDGSALLTSITLGPRARRCRDSPAPHEPVASTPIAPTSPKRDPAGQVPVAARRGYQRCRVPQPAQLVAHDRDMDVLVGVDPGHDTQVVAICDGGHATPFF